MASTPRSDMIIRFFYNDYVGRIGRYLVYIGKAEDGTLLGEVYANALPMEIVAFLSMHGTCAECGAHVHMSLTPCACGKQIDHGAHLKVVVVDRAGTPTFNQLLGREIQRVKSKRRQRRMRESSPTLTAAEVALLLRLQSALCFYCGELFALNEQGPIFHRDHYEPLVGGGETTFANTVLACPLCNSRKGALDGPSFSRISAAARRPEIRGRYATMRRHFRAGVAKYLRDKQAQATQW